VGVGFIRSWLAGQGTFVYRGAVEDSATAEISRSQVWQWIRRGALAQQLICRLPFLKRLFSGGFHCKDKAAFPHTSFGLEKSVFSL
jgi:hypothetical protein